MADERLTYTVEEAGRVLGIGRNAAYDAVNRGEIPSLRLGKRLVVPKVALDRLLSGERATVAAPTVAYTPWPESGQS